MKRAVTTLLALAMLTVAGSAFAQVRISQVYGGGGGGATTAATYNQDYVELFNASGVAINISGWQIAYGSATGNWASASGNQFTLPANTVIESCSYLLIAVGTVSTNPDVPGVPSPDLTNSGPNMAAASGKVALFNTPVSNVPCGSEPAGTLVDKVAYGTSNCAEGTAVGVLSTTTAAVRNNGGLDDTDNNSADFTIVTNAVPRNSQSPPNAGCQPTSAPHSTWGAIKGMYR
jgi:hypothetical protein